MIRPDHKPKELDAVDTMARGLLPGSQGTAFAQATNTDRRASCRVKWSYFVGQSEGKAKGGFRLVLRALGSFRSVLS